MLPIVGVSMRDDVIERGNPAAAIVAGGTMLASGIVYAGANIGLGATIWSTITPALMAAVALAAAAMIVRIVSPVAEAVAIDRDVLSSAGDFRWVPDSPFRSSWPGPAAGDFVNWDNTESDFIGTADGWRSFNRRVAIAILWIKRPRIVRQIGGR